MITAIYIQWKNITKYINHIKTQIKMFSYERIKMINKLVDTKKYLNYYK